MKRINRSELIAITIVVLTIVFLAVSVMFSDISDIGETSNGVLVTTPTTPTSTPAPVIEVKPPVNLKLEDNLLTWDAVDEVDGYLVIIGGQSIPLDSNFFNIEDFFDRLRTGDNTIGVVARKGDVRSAVSEFSYVLSIRPPSNIKISASASSSSVQIDWDQVQNASAYVVIFDNNYELQTSTNSLRLAFSEIENNTALMSATDIRVVSVDRNGNRSVPSRQAVLLNQLLVAPSISFKGAPFSEIQWTYLTNIPYYTVTVGDKSISTRDNKLRIKELDLQPGIHSFIVTANILGFSSEPSNEINEFWGYLIELPQLPLRVCIRCDSPTQEKTYEMTNIDYEYDGQTSTNIFYTGRLVESAEGSNTAVSDLIGIRILDSEGFVVYSGRFGISALFPGEGFRNEQTTWYPYQSNLPYGRYRLDIIAIQN